MPLNLQKTQVVRFGRSASMPEYTLLGRAIEVTQIRKDLGVQIDSSLKFANHIETAVTKSMRLNGWMMRTFRSRKVTVLISVYKSIVRPTLE